MVTIISGLLTNVCAVASCHFLDLWVAHKSLAVIGVLVAIVLGVLIWEWLEEEPVKPVPKPITNRTPVTTRHHATAPRYGHVSGGQQVAERRRTSRARATMVPV